MPTSRDDFGIAIRSALLQRGAKQKFSLFVLIVILRSHSILIERKVYHLKVLGKI